MLKVHLDDGRTLSIDLTDEGAAREWLERVKMLQEQITGLSIDQRGVQYSLPKPSGFGDAVFLYARRIQPDGRLVKGAEEIYCHAGEVGIRLRAFDEHRAARVDVTLDGKQKFNPIMHRRSS